MHDAPAKRKFSEEKEAFHNAIIAVPFFLSAIPTKIVAVSRDHLLLSNMAIQHKLYFNGSRFVRTRIVAFGSAEEARRFHDEYQRVAVTGSQGREWVQYCKDISQFEGVLFHNGRVFVPWLQPRELREMVGELSQLVVYQGLFIEEHLRRTASPLLPFLDDSALSLQHTYYRWRTYAYLQNDGDRRYRTEPFCIVRGGSQWVPPMSSTIQRGILNHRQRRYFSLLINKLSRKKQDIEEAMVFAISRLDCAVEVVSIIAIELLGRASEDLMPLFHLVSDILFNATTPDYRRLFARVIPFVVLELTTAKHAPTASKQKEAKMKSELKSLIQLWEIKFIFDQNYTKGLLFLLGASEGGRKSVPGIHERLKVIGELEDEQESEFQLQKLCFSNGIPFLQGDKDESTRLINECLWLYAKAQEIVPQINQNYDGEPISEKDLIKIKNKQVKVVTCEGLSIGLLLQKNWQTKPKASSIDLE